MVAGIDFGKLLADPNFQQGLGNAGAALSRGESFGEALNPAPLIAQIQQQKATTDLLKALSGGRQVGGQSQLGQTNQNDLSTVPTMDDWNKLITPTPIGTPGPDKIDWSTTADGSTLKVKIPSKVNSFGTSVPAETQPKQSSLEVGGQLPSPLGLGDIDLRGLGPDQLNMLLSGAINLKNISSRELTEQQQAELNALKIQLDTAEKKAKQKREESKVTRDVVEEGGKRYEVTYDYLGKEVSRKGLGDKAPESYKPDVFEDAQGNLKRVAIGDPIPKGYKMPRNVDLTTDQLFKQRKDLASIEAVLSSGVSTSGDKIDDISIMQGWADVYNESNPNYNMVLVPARPGKKVLGITIPGTSTPAEYIKLPKDAKPAPPEAIDYLKTHPELKNDFLSHYGYLPEGM